MTPCSSLPAYGDWHGTVGTEKKIIDCFYLIVNTYRRLLGWICASVRVEHSQYPSLKVFWMPAGKEKL